MCSVMIKQRYLPRTGENRCEMNARGPNREVRGPKMGCGHRKWCSAAKWVSGTPVFLGMIKQRYLPKTGENRCKMKARGPNHAVWGPENWL